MLNYTPLTQVRVAKKPFKVEGWQIGVLLFFVVACAIAIMVYGYMNFQENERIAKEAQRIANAPVLRPTATPEPTKPADADPLGAVQNALRTENYKIVIYGKIPFPYPFTPQEIEIASALDFPKDADYAKATELYSIKGNILKLRRVGDLSETNVVMDVASNSANLIDYTNKTFTPLPLSGESALWATFINRYFQYASPLWLLQQAGPYSKRADYLWSGTFPSGGKQLFVTLAPETGLPTRIELVSSGSPQGAITLDMQKVDDSTAFARVPSQFQFISLKEATDSSKILLPSRR